MSRDLIKIIVLFLFWRLALVVFLVTALIFVPLAFEDRFLGGGPRNYLLAPELFSWANFDGEHYLSIAIIGYKGLEQAFFPVYPRLISFFAGYFYDDHLTSLVASVLAGIFLTHLALLLSLVLLWRLIRIDYAENIAFLTLVVLLIFPTSFYLGAVYSESLFLLLALISFYSARKGRWWLAGVSGALASGTRIFGIVLLPALILEILQQRISWVRAWWIVLIPIGLLSYMYYQWWTVGDPLAFYRLQKIVGEQHQSGFTLLPQVYYRYIKMLLTVDFYAPIYQTVFLEAVVGVLFFLLPIIGLFRRVRLSYLVFAMSGFLLPTIQGSFSSVPRYVLVLFPSFLILALLISKWPRWVKVLYFVISFSWLAVESALFLRGYWIA